jgi:integrase
MRQGLYEPDAAKTRVAELIEDLKRDYRVNGQNEKDVAQRWKHLEPVFGNDLAQAVTMTRLTKYVEARLGEKAKAATVQRELACLRRALGLGFKAGKVFRVPPFPTITVNNAREIFFERNELEALLKELPDDFMRPLVTLAYWIGFRRGELLKLEWRQVDLDRGTVRLGIGTTKNKDGRLVYLPADALMALKAWRERTSTVEREQTRIITRVFHRNGQPIPVRNFPYEVWHAARERAKLPHRVPHDFRRTMARNYRRSAAKPKASSCESADGKRAVSSSATTSSTKTTYVAPPSASDSNGAKTGQIIPVEMPGAEEHGA